jgi:hypothetical protein
MKIFETPVIEVITFTAESIMDASSTTPPAGEDRLPWG